MVPFNTRRSVLAGFACAALAAGLRPSTAKIVVTKDPSCGCCSGWIDHLRTSGFKAEVIESPKVNRLKVRLGVPQDLATRPRSEAT